MVGVYSIYTYLYSLACGVEDKSLCYQASRGKRLWQHKGGVRTEQHNNLDWTQLLPHTRGVPALVLQPYHTVGGGKVDNHKDVRKL